MFFFSKTVAKGVKMSAQHIISVGTSGDASLHGGEI